MSSKDLAPQGHRALARWAADCAEHVLSYFEKIRTDDDRPRLAVKAARAWASGEAEIGAARAAAFAAHAAARDADDPAARAAARSAGHAAATAHVADHARHAADYAVAAASAAASADAVDSERDWQKRRLPQNLRHIVFPD